MRIKKLFLMTLVVALLLMAGSSVQAGPTDWLKNLFTGKVIGEQIDETEFAPLDEEESYFVEETGNLEETQKIPLVHEDEVVVNSLLEAFDEQNNLDQGQEDLRAFHLGIVLQGRPVDAFREFNPTETSESTTDEGSDTFFSSVGGWFAQLFDNPSTGPATSSARQGTDPPKPGEEWNGLKECADNGPMPDIPKPTPPTIEPPQGEPPTKPEPPRNTGPEECKECVNFENVSIIPRNTTSGEKITYQPCMERFATRTCKTINESEKVDLRGCAPYFDDKDEQVGAVPHDYRGGFTCKDYVTKNYNIHICDRSSCKPRQIAHAHEECRSYSKPCWQYGGVNKGKIQIWVRGCAGAFSPIKGKEPKCEWEEKVHWEEQEGWSHNTDDCKVEGEGDAKACTGSCHVQFRYPEDNCKALPENKAKGLCDLHCQKLKIQKGLE